ncbi:unnamed protein product [Boreogadus saida]
MFVPRGNIVLCSPCAANPSTTNASPCRRTPVPASTLPRLANGGIYLYASPCYPTPVYLYASPCFPTPIYLYSSPCRPTPIYLCAFPCWFAATPIPYTQRLPLLAETTPASLQPQHQTAAPNCSPTPSPSRRAFPDIMASLDVQPRLMEARPDPDTPAQMRAAVARYLAANALKDKALSTEQQKTWAAREEKRANGLRRDVQTRREKDSVDYRKKREKYSYALLNAYNAAINMETRKREGRPTDLSRQEKMVLKGLTVPPHVEERAAPLTLEGADVEGKETPCGEDNTSLRNNTYPSLEENPPFPNNTRAPPPYGCYDHQAPRDFKGPALQFPILHIEKGPVEVLYNDQPPPSFAERSLDYGGVDYDSTKGPKDGTDRVIKGRSGPGAIIGREADHPPGATDVSIPQPYSTQQQQQVIPQPYSTQQQQQVIPQPYSTQQQQVIPQPYSTQQQQQVIPQPYSTQQQQVIPHPYSTQQQVNPQPYSAQQQQLQPNTQSYPAQHQQQQQLQPGNQQYQQLQPGTQQQQLQPGNQQQQHQQQLQPNTQSYPVQNQQHQQQLQPNTESYPAQNQQQQHQQQLQPNTQSYPAQNQQQQHQ